MVVLNKIYTKGGDAGETALVNGSRVAKHALRVSCYGTVDETNATLGLARLHATGEMDARLAMIQNDLFDLGADLGRPDMEKDHEVDYPVLRMSDAQVARLESELDAMTKDVAPLTSFVLPGGSALAAHLHLCRTVSRRAERLAVELATVESVNVAAVKYLNRLSDWFFQASRIANDNGKDDVFVGARSESLNGAAAQVFLFTSRPRVGAKHPNVASSGTAASILHCCSQVRVAIPSR